MCRASESVRASRTGVPGPDAEGGQTSIDECDYSGSSAERQCDRDLGEDPGRAKCGTVWHGELWFGPSSARKHVWLIRHCIMFLQEMSNHIFQTCYNLCRLNKSRQEEAAQAGIIPSLKRVIESSSPLKQFALPILCDLASAGKSCRILLWQHDGLSMYLRLLEDPYFQVSGLESILSWYVNIFRIFRS